MPPKKTYNALTISKKLELLEEIDKNELSKSKLAIQFGIPNSTLSTILKNRYKIEKYVEVRGSLQRVRLRPAKHEDLESQLYEYFVQIRAANLPVTGPLLKEKADELSLVLNIVGFKCSNGWLWRFQRQFNIVCLAVCGEATKVNKEEVEAWLARTQPIFSNFAAKDMDETGIFYNMLLDRTLAHKG